ncbi:50S ribosomal protein L21 [Candidatus Gottesmanbacteria bacterium]|nr:50S ribosomal protein L21 [Candidatus Gottesmanbacteria bacterium]
MFAVVVIGGKQYPVAKGETLTVDSQEGAVGDTLTFDRVLLVEDEGKVIIGKPVINGAKVKAKILSQEKGEKLHIRRYKSKVRYRKSTGFRAHLTKLEVESIT